jgi:hypothetical protein
MPKRGPNKRVTYLVDYFDYNLFGIKLVNALTVCIGEKTHKYFLLSGIKVPCLSTLKQPYQPVPTLQGRKPNSSISFEYYSLKFYIKLIFMCIYKKLAHLKAVN